MNYKKWLSEWELDLRHSFDIGIDPNGYPIEQETVDGFIQAAWEAHTNEQNTE